MSAQTNVPIPYFGAAGFSAPSASSTFAGVMADFNQAFGGSLNLDPAEPQGQLGTSLTACIGFFQDLFLAYVNGVDPATSSGRMQDALGRLTVGFQRIAAASTTVTATCTGAPGIVIPLGALAQTQGGDIYAALNGGTIPSSGSISLQFANVATGAVACPAGYLNAVYQAVPGWDTITNPAAGALGNDQESSTAFEARRQASVAANAVGSNAAIKGNILATVPGVVSAYVVDNSTNAAATIGGVTLAPNSLYVCVYGGVSTAIAKAIWQKKSGGCSYNGTTTVVVQDTGHGYTSPYPSYNVSFTYATPLSLTVAVTISNNTQVPASAVAQIQAAVLSVFSGTDNTGLGIPQIGANIYGNRFYAPIAGLGNWAQIISILIGCSNDSDAASFTASIASNVMTVTAVSAGTLLVGQTIGGALPNTKITGQTSGTTGKTGTYTVSNAQTLASSVLSSYSANQPYCSVNINQIPVLNQADISVVLQ